MREKNEIKRLIGVLLAITLVCLEIIAPVNIVRADDLLGVSQENELILDENSENDLSIVNESNYIKICIKSPRDSK